LRLTGKGPTLQHAVEDLDALPRGHRLRKLAAGIIGLFHLDKRRRRHDTDEELYMRITDPTYLQFIQEQQHIGWLAGKTEGKMEGIQQGKAEGKAEGQRAALARYLSKRFGEDVAVWRASLEQIHSAEVLEVLGDAIYDAADKGAALAAIAQAKG
jgi:hypothetical protein